MYSSRNNSVPSSHHHGHASSNCQQRTIYYYFWLQQSSFNLNEAPRAFNLLIRHVQWVLLRSDVVALLFLGILVTAHIPSIMHRTEERKSNGSALNVRFSQYKKFKKKKRCWRVFFFFSASREHLYFNESFSLLQFT